MSKIQKNICETGMGRRGGEGWLSRMEGVGCRARRIFDSAAQVSGKQVIPPNGESVAVSPPRDSENNRCAE